MSNNKKLIIQALAMVIISVLLYREWDNVDAKIFYVEILCIIEVLIEVLYLKVNKDTLDNDEKDREKIAILLFLIALTGIFLFSSLIVR